MPDLIRRAGAQCATLALAVLLTACSETLTAPGSCPDFCSPNSLSLIDTVLPAAIDQDSSFGRPIGYVSPGNSLALLAVSAPGRESRPILRSVPVPTRLVVDGDTATGAVVGVDSLQLILWITSRDTTAHNLTLSLYPLPLTIDSTTAFHDLDGPFAGAVIRSLNLDSLLAKPGLKDPVTGDSALVDANHRIKLWIGLDSAQLPLVPADSGKVGLGIRVSADSRASVSMGSVENGGLSPVVIWFLKVDSLGLKVIHPAGLNRQPAFDTFVYDPPSQPLGTSLVVGGVPAARTVLRMALPQVIRDSSRVVRATLEFIAAAQLEGSAADSFPVVAHPVIADFGAKSPLNAAHTDTTWISIVPIDTVRIDVTNVLAFWTTDPAQPSTLVLRALPEGGEFPELRWHNSADVAQRPKLHITYAPRYPVTP